MVLLMSVHPEEVLLEFDHWLFIAYVWLSNTLVRSALIQTKIQEEVKLKTFSESTN